MYYNLNKKEYKEYEKKFNKVYVGKQLFQARFFPAILGCILWGIAGGNIGYHSVESIQVSLFDIVLFFIGGLSLLECVLWHIEYRRELKNYILEKNK